jgi:hypothetical protein
MKVGIIAEYQSDVDVLIGIIRQIKPDSAFDRCTCSGSGRLVSKCNAFSEVLFKKGCTHLVIVRDSDGEDSVTLKNQIKKALKKSAISNHIIVVAVHEIESWLLADIEAIHKSFSAGTANLSKQITSPEEIPDPKRYLKKLVRKQYKMPYMNTVHNKKIAEQIDVSKIRIKCPSFCELFDFINSQ